MVDGSAFLVTGDSSDHSSKSGIVRETKEGTTGGKFPASTPNSFLKSYPRDTQIRKCCILSPLPIQSLDLDLLSPLPRASLPLLLPPHHLF